MRVVLALALVASMFGAPKPRQKEMIMKKLTPVLHVENIEPSLPFWEDQLGFSRTAEVPHEDKLGFVILEKDGIEIMYQTRASVVADNPAIAESLPVSGALLFIEVEELDPIDEALKDYERAAPRRTTFYGADEIVVREPGGNLVVFAEFGDPD